MITHKEVDLDYVKSNYELENLETVLKQLLKNDSELQLVESRISNSVRINLVRSGKFLSTISK